MASVAMNSSFATGKAAVAARPARSGRAARASVVVRAGKYDEELIATAKHIARYCTTLI